VPVKRLVFARWMAVALVPAAVLSSRAAAAQTEPAYSQEEESTEPAPSEPKPPDPKASQGVARVSLVGGYRGLFDLSMLGGGVQLSYGSDGPVSGHANLRLFDGRTLGGLGVVELSGTAIAEFATHSGVRFGIGGGIAGFGITRATNGNLIMSCGPEGLLRLGYDFAPHHAVFVLADLDVEWQANVSLVWGPTLAVGYRF
jgi:hypothetical protein